MANILIMIRVIKAKLVLTLGLTHSESQYIISEITHATMILALCQVFNTCVCRPTCSGTL